MIKKAVVLERFVEKTDGPEKRLFPLLRPEKRSSTTSTSLEKYGFERVSWVAQSKQRPIFPVSRPPLCHLTFPPRYAGIYAFQATALERSLTPVPAITSSFNGSHEPLRIFTWSPGVHTRGSRPAQLANFPAVRQRFAQNACECVYIPTGIDEPRLAVLYQIKSSAYLIAQHDRATAQTSLHRPQPDRGRIRRGGSKMSADR